MWFHIVLLSTGLALVQNCGESTGNLKIQALVEIKGATVSGNVTFTQSKLGGPVSIEGVIIGLSQGLHGFHVHEKGDLSGGCATTGAHYNPDKNTHGGPNDLIRHRGDLGNIVADENGVAKISQSDNLISLFGAYNVIGRAVVVHATRDDHGKGGFSDSLTTGNAGARLGCGVITEV